MQAAAPGQEKSELHFGKNRVFLPPPLFLLHGTAGAGPHRASPAGVTAGSHGAEVPPGPGTTGQGCPGHRDRCSGSRREAPSLGKPSPGGGDCCPRRGSGASAALCAQGAHSAPDAFSNLARLVRLRQRGRGVSALTLARPRSRPRCEGGPGGEGGRAPRGPRAEPREASRGPAWAQNPPGQRTHTRAELAASPREAQAQQQLGLQLPCQQAVLGTGREHTRGARAPNPKHR